MKALLESLGPSDPDLALALAIDPHRLPAHIAVIMDGNGRWANRRLLPRVAGHQAGIQPVRTIVESCAALGLEALEEAEGVGLAGRGRDIRSIPEQLDSTSGEDTYVVEAAS